MINYDDKIYLINLKIDFWTQRLQESRNAVVILKDLGNQIKIDSNLLDIDNYSKVILALEQEKMSLTNQD
jgi:hypothetical protein